MRRIAFGDACCAVFAALVGDLIRFGGEAGALPASSSRWTVILLPVVWLVAMLTARSYEPRFLWVGAEEFRRVFTAATILLASVGTVAWGLQIEVARGFVVIALPLVTLLTLTNRYVQRKLLHHARGEGRCQQTTLVVGLGKAVAALRTQLEREVYQGYRVVGWCLPAKEPVGPSGVFHGLPVLGRLDEVADVVARHEIDTVAVLPCPELDGPALRRLGWALERTPAELLLAPTIVEIAGPRVHIRPIAGLPLVHMERPELRGYRRLTKQVFDLTAAALILLTTAPLLACIAIAVVVTSRGPVLFRQERVGRDGAAFSMFKFRTMAHGAPDMASGGVDDGNGVLFKLRRDPRVTRLGRVLRRYSLDELPQLFNVLRGEMSLVGPRPPLPSEVDRYGPDMHRRFLVKPGLTGLWQVSGRSDLSWDDSVRADVLYVESWSLTFDLMILWKTVGAVLRGAGAY